MNKNLANLVLICTIPFDGKSLLISFFSEAFGFGSEDGIFLVSREVFKSLGLCGVLSDLGLCGVLSTSRVFLGLCCMILTLGLPTTLLVVCSLGVVSTLLPLGEILIFDCITVFAPEFGRGGRFACLVGVLSNVCADCERLKLFVFWSGGVLFIVCCLLIGVPVLFSIGVSDFFCGVAFMPSSVLNKRIDL